MIHLSRKLITASVALLLSLAVTTDKLCAQDAPAAAAPAAAAPAADAPAGPQPSIEQRVGILEAYLTNGDPSAPLKTATAGELTERTVFTDIVSFPVL